MAKHRKIKIFDTVDASSIRMTSDGYLAGKVRVARTGIQKYKGTEVGMPHLDHVSVYRPAEQVFARDSLHSYAHRPVTNDHPPVAVNADNWKKYAVGQIGGEVARDGDYVTVPLVLMDAGVIKDWKNGKKQLSLGYQTDLVWESGKSPQGEVYDAIQTDIRANHLAVVAAARGGPELKIGDDKPEGTVSMKTMTIDGISVEVSDVAVQVISKVLDTQAADIASLTKKLSARDTEFAAITTASATKDAEIVTLKKQVEDSKLTPQALDALVKDRSEVVVSAKKMIGDKLIIDGKTISDMRRQVVSDKLGVVAKDWNDDQVTASFNTLAASTTSDVSTGRYDKLADALSSNKSSHSNQEARDAAYNEYEKNLNNAWKGKAA